MNPQLVVTVKDRLLQLLNDRESFTAELNSLNSTFDTKAKELESIRDIALEELKTNTTEYIKAEAERQKRIYTTKINELTMEKDKAFQEIERKIEESKTKFLQNNSKPLVPIQKFKTQDAYLKQVVEGIPVHTIYAECSKPTFHDLKDVHLFNQHLSKLGTLEGIKDVDLAKYETKAPLILKPVEVLVTRLGENRRVFIELGYFLVGLSMLASYRQIVLPLVTVPTTILLYNRFRNTLTLKKYCSTYFQAHKYSGEIEDSIKKLLLQNQEKELDAYRHRARASITDTYNKECQKIKAPDNSNLGINTDDSTILAQYKAALQTLTKEREDTKADLTFKLNSIGDEIKNAMSELTTLTTECKTMLDTQETQGVLPPYVHYGEIVNRHYGISYPYLSPTIKESCCVTYDDVSRQDSISFLKYYLLQLWRHVEPGFVKLHIIDTVDFGKDFADITVKDDRLIDIYTETNDVTALLAEAIKELKSRNTTILRKHSSIEEYNRVMHQQDASIIPYQIYINVNPQMDYLMSPSHLALIQQASSCGILLINLMNKDIFTSLKPEEYDKAIQMYEHHEYKVMFENNNIVGGLTLQQHEVFTPMKINKAKYVEVADNLYDILKKGAIKPLWYVDHRKRNFPENWGKIPIQNIEVQPGNLGGDKDKPVTLRFGEENPHVLIAGETGSGKSVLLNSVLLSICHNYSPDWVQIVGVDFKGVELLVYGKPVSMPHFRVASASRDPDYVLSIFDDLIGEMRARNKLFDKVLGFKDFSTFAKAMQNPSEKQRIWQVLMDIRGNKELQTLLETKEGKNLYKSITRNGKYPVLPRLLFVIDEFADMFLISDDLKADVTARIKSLAKVARSAGIHMVFASQNMEGTVPEETLEQFKLRICLPCSNNVAKSLTGNSEAAHITKGYAIANNNPADKEKANVYFKVAFAELDTIKGLIKELNTNSRELGYPEKIPIYDEAETFDYQNFRSRLVKNSKLYESPVYILGEPRVYQRMDIPVTLSTAFKERQNVCIIAKDRDLMDSMSVVYMDNYAKKGQMVYFQTGDDDFLDKYDFVGQFDNIRRCEYSTQVADLYQWLTNMIAHRTQARKNGDNIKPIQVILHSINNMTSFGIEGVSDDVQELLTDSIMELNKLQVYFVLCGTSAKSMRRLFPFFTHVIVGGVDERDLGYLPEIAQKALRSITANQMFYVNSDTSVIKSFKPYSVYKTETVDDSVYFTA